MKTTRTGCRTWWSHGARVGISRETCRASRRRRHADLWQPPLRKWGALPAERSGTVREIHMTTELEEAWSKLSKLHRKSRGAGVGVLVKLIDPENEAPCRSLATSSEYMTDVAHREICHGAEIHLVLSIARGMTESWKYGGVDQPFWVHLGWRFLSGIVWYGGPNCRFWAPLLAEWDYWVLNGVFKVMLKNMVRFKSRLWLVCPETFF